jgi:hypothetical protein
MNKPSRAIPVVVGLTLLLAAVVHETAGPNVNPTSLLFLGSGAMGVGWWLRRLAGRRDRRNI